MCSADSWCKIVCGLVNFGERKRARSVNRRWSIRIFNHFWRWITEKVVAETTALITTETNFFFCFYFSKIIQIWVTFIALPLLLFLPFSFFLFLYFLIFWFRESEFVRRIYRVLRVFFFFFLNCSTGSNRNSAIFFEAKESVER